MKKSLIAIASILAIVAGCAKNDPQAKVSDGTIKASIENTQSRATLSYGGETDNYLVWEEEDSFLLFDGTSGIKCTLVSGEGTKFGSFTPESEPAQVEIYYAVYPYNNSSVGTDGVFSVVIPDEVEYNPETGVAEAGEDGSANVMVAESSSTEIAFKNVCSYLCLAVTGTSDQKVSSINILPKDGETTVAGTAQITIDGGEPVLAFDGTVTSNTESVVFAEPVSLENKLEVKIAVAPVYTDGFQVIVCLEDGTYQILTSDTAIGRNEIVDMPEFAFAATEVAQIGDVKYTSLATAVEAANAATQDVIIKLIDNVIVTETVAIENADHKVTLDMNSKVISADAKAMDIKSDVDIIDSSAEKEGAIVSATSYAFYAITDGITMNISDVAFEGAAQYGAARIAGDASVFNISGNASFLNTKEGKTSEYAGLHIGLSAKANTPTVNISGGTFESYSTYGVRNRYGICNVTGGVFTGKTAAFCDASGGNNAVSITGGYFSNTGDTDVINNEGGHINGAISGGYFTKELSAVLLAEGYVCAAESTTGPDGKEYAYKVKEGVLNVASVIAGAKTTDYSSIGDAIAAADNCSEACTLRLLADVKADSVTFTNTNCVTIDLNGKKITTSLCVNGGNLKLSDLSEGKKGEVVRSGNRTTINIINGATLVFEGGKINGPTSSGKDYTAVCVRSSSKFIMNDGYIDGKSERGAVKVEDGEAEFNGGFIEAYGKYGRCFTTSAEGGKVTVNDGRFVSPDCIARNYALAEIYINGGKFETIENEDGGVNDGMFWFSASISKFSISGGLFGQSAADKNGFIKFGDGKKINTLEVIGGIFTKNYSDQIPASEGYKWSPLTEPDETSLPGYSLTFKVEEE